MALKFDHPTNEISSQTPNSDLTLSGNGSGAVVVQGRLGVGTDSPQSALHAYGSSPKLRLQDDDAFSSYLDIRDNSENGGYISKTANSAASNIYMDAIPADGVSDGRVRLFRNTNTTGSVNITVTIGDGTTDSNALIAGKGISSYLSRYSGNFGVRSVSFGTNAVGAVSIGNGTAPASSPADSVQLYAADVTASSELFVRDEAGNVTQLSPHAAGSLEVAFPGADDKSIPLPMVVHHRNDYLGREEWIHLSKLAQAVERLTGEQFVYHRPTEDRDWNADQQAADSAQQQKIDQWRAKKAEWEATHDTPYDDEEPQSHENAHMPAWIQERLNSK